MRLKKVIIAGINNSAVVTALSSHLAGAALAPPAVTYYVATNGSDQWAGKLPAPNAAKTDGPFASIERARNAIRQLKAQPGGLKGPVTVQIRGGTYYIPAAIRFTAEDSGTAEAPISYEAYPGEEPILSGGRRITGFRPVEGQIQAVALPEVSAGQWYFRSLFAAGSRQIRARYPNFDPQDPYRGGFLYVAPSPGSFPQCVGNIHNVGDSMTYQVSIPAEGEYTVWVYYAALNQPFGAEDMGGRTALRVDGGEPVRLMNLPDTGSWNTFQWARSATLPLAAGERQIRWENLQGGGLNLQALVLSDDPAWQPVKGKPFRAGPGKHVVVIPAAEFVASHGSQLSVAPVTEEEASPKVFRYRPGDFKATWAQAPGAEVHIFQSGDCRAFKEIVSIEQVDEEACLVTVGGPEARSKLATGDRYFVENLREELDRPGEWYLDQEAGVLYYWPPQNDAEPVVVAPFLGRMFEFQGDEANGQPVSHIRLAGLTLQETDYSPEDGCDGYGMGHDGVIYLNNARNCEVEDCRFVNIGKYAVCLVGGGENRVQGSEISHSAEGGVLLLRTARNTVSDNHIHHCGAVYKHIGGVVLEGAGTDENLVAHNLIHDMSRYGISLKNAGRRNVVEYNSIHRTNLETYDTGGIEVTQHDREFRSHSTIRYNVVGDTIGYSSVGGKPVYLSWGIYLDSFASGYDVHHNIVCRNHNGGIMLQGGKDNQVWNNIFVDGTTYQGFVSNFAGNSTGQVMERNIFCWSAPEAALYAAGPLTQEIIRVDYNLYWPPGGQEPRTGWGGQMSFRDWQKAGFDQHSQIADPLFVDPQNDRYELRPASPAFVLGFEAIETSQIGPRKK